jgi:hypothetical protein
MARTNFTQEIDGALAGRNAGMRHFSDVARSGNGDMRTDLAEDLADYHEVPGVGETREELSLPESASVDRDGAMASVPGYRWPAPGEVPPYAAKPGYVWLRKRVVTASRKPGGNRLAKVSWVMVSKERLIAMQRTGDLAGSGLAGIFDSMGMPLSIGLGLAGGLAVWFLFMRKKKS